jgi:hypothetical protein
VTMHSRMKSRTYARQVLLALLTVLILLYSILTLVGVETAGVCISASASYSDLLDGFAFTAGVKDCEPEVRDRVLKEDPTEVAPVP